MKKLKFFALLLALVMVLSAFAACNNANDADAPATDAPTTDAPITNPSSTDAPATDDPTTDTPATDDPTTDKPTPDSSETDTPAVDNPEVPSSNELVLFNNREFLSNVIRADEADDLSKETYNALRAAIKTAVGKMPEVSTDFDVENADKAAILVGNTSFAESAEVYSKLKTGEATAKFVNGKYVLAYTSENGAVKLVEEVAKLMNKYVKENPGSIVIDYKWNIKLSVGDIEGYDKDMLSSYLDIPEYNGRAFDQSNIALGSSSFMHIAKNTTLSEYEAYIEELYLNGFVLYTENEIGNNLYGTFLTESQIVNVMYLGDYSQVRVVVDDREEFDLPGLEMHNKYEEVTDPSLTVIGVGATGWPGGMGYVYKLADGSFFIIDGGIVKTDASTGISSAEWLYATLRDLADDPDNIVIAGWLLTHTHKDHLGAFIDMAEEKKCRDHITIKQVIYNQPTDEIMTETGHPDRIPWMPDALALWQPESIVKAHPGQVFYYCDLTVTVLSSQELIIPQKTDSHNNHSIVTMVDYKDMRALYLGDAEGLMNRALEDLYGDELQCDILQLAHHGYHNTEADGVYEIADPTIVFWPVSTGHYDGSGGATVRDVSFNQRFFAPGIDNHIAGETNMTITDFYSWIPEEARWEPNM